VSPAVPAQSPPESVLVVRLGAMGDIIHTLPAVAALRSAFSDIRIGWIVEERWAELLCAAGTPRSGRRDAARPLVDFVHAVNTKHWRKSLLSRDTQRQIASALREVRAQKYKIAVDFQGALKSAAIARASGAKTTLGMNNPREGPARLFYEHRIAVKGAHVIEQYRSLAEAVAGRSLDFVAAALPVDRNAEQAAGILKKKDFAIITPGAGWGAKQWPAERYGEVAKVLHDDGIASLINAAPNEEPLARKVEAACSGPAERISCSIGELIALTRHARLFVGGDTGPLHLAAALQVPVVAIFCPTDPARTGPYGTKSIVIRNSASRSSLSHTSAPDPGILNVTVSEVMSAVRRLLETVSA
jgi:heptosyltransferase-1